MERKVIVAQRGDLPACTLYPAGKMSTSDFDHVGMDVQNMYATSVEKGGQQVAQVFNGTICTFSPSLSTRSLTSFLPRVQETRHPVDNKTYLHSNYLHSHLFC